MVFFKVSAMFLVAVLMWQVDSASINVPECPPNSTDEKILQCQLACDDLDSSEKVCVFSEEEDFCKCNDGFIAKQQIYHAPAECIKPEECNVTCRPNKHYEPYASGCQPTCNNPTIPEPCDKKNSPQCVCNEGYILSPYNSNCVKKDECF